MNTFGIDTTANFPSKFVSRLQALKGVLMVEDCGEYRHVPGWRKLKVTTILSEQELDNWCYRYKEVGRFPPEANVFEW